MRTIYCGKIHIDEFMQHCLALGLFTQEEQFNEGYNWSVPQTVIYTNNEHFFNGVRVAIKEGKISKDEIKIIYTNQDGEEFRPLIDKNGHVDFWPDGFFDQITKELLRLL